MSQTPPTQDHSRSTLFTMGFAPLAIGGEVGCLTIAIVVISLVAGLWLDRTFDTKPVFTLILLLGSAPVSLYLTFQIARRSVNRLLANQPPQKAGEKPVKEDDFSE